MSVRRLKSKQLGPWCDWCDASPVRAVWRGTCFQTFACENHLENLKAQDAHDNRPDHSEAAWEAGL